jgi:hypothetical protein
VVAAGLSIAAGGVAEAKNTVKRAVKTPEIYPLSEVRRGQKGYGLSTFEGSEPERWEFEVVGVMKNFRPKMDIILVKSDDEKMQTPGFWRGMSGSPLFIDGKLVCAFSYGFSFNKKPIGGCTPIEFMIDEGLNAPVRGNPVVQPSRKRKQSKAGKASKSARRSSFDWVSPGAATADEWASLAPDGRVDTALSALGDERAPWILRAPLPPAPTVASKPDDTDPDAMVPAAVPLAISGFSGPAYEKAKQLMAPYPVEPMQAGGTGSSDEGPDKFALGAPISVQLARGDASFAATGTVSYMTGGKVLAFGHPFFEQGEFYAPVTAAEVHTVIPSQISGFVLASPMRELGSLVQDRLPAIMADTSFRNKMVPMSVFVEAGQGKEKQTSEFHVEIVNNKFLTAPLAGLMAMNAINRYLPDRDHATVRMDSKVRIKGYEPIEFTDYLYSSDGAGSIIGGARGLRVLVPLMFNPYKPLDVESIEIKFDLSFDANYGEITDLRLASSSLIPGKRNYVTVVMQRYDDKEVTQKIPFDVPKSLAGSIVKLEVVPGDVARVDAAAPDDLDDMVALFREMLPGDIFAVTIYTAETGVAVDGKLVRDLPASAIDRFHSGSSSERTQQYKAIVRTTAPSKRVINGGKNMLVKVADL